MDDVELARRLQRWRRAEDGAEVASAGSALRQGLRRRGTPAEAFAAALRAAADAPDARWAERLGYLLGLGFGDPRLATGARPRGIACGPSGTPVAVAVSEGELARVGPEGGVLEPIPLPPEASLRVEWIGVDYDASGDLWWLVRPRRHRDRIRRFRLPSGRGPAEEVEPLAVEASGRRPAMVTGVGREPAVLVERNNRQIWLHTTGGAARLADVESHLSRRVATGAGPGLMAVVLWRFGGGLALPVVLLDPAGEVVDRFELGGVPDLFHWLPDGTLQLGCVDTQPSVVWSRDRGAKERPRPSRGPPRDEDGPTRIWRDHAGHLWDCGPDGLRTWPDADVTSDPAATDYGVPVAFSPSGRRLAWFGTAGPEVRDLAGGTRWLPAAPWEELSRPAVLVDDETVALARGRRVELVPLVSASAQVQ